MNPIETVLKFEQAINSRKVDDVIALVTEDSVFIDSLGNRMEGTSKLRNAWTSYFKMVPDYSISHSEIYATGFVSARGMTVCVFGSAQGTYAKSTELKKEDFWTTPAAWRAMVKDGKITLWQVFADNEPIRAIMRKYQ